MREWYYRIKEHKGVSILGLILIIFVFGLNVVIILRGTANFIHSDDATVILFAREQWMQKKLHPVGWCYGTDIWNIGLNTLILPFFLLCDHWVNARACAVIVQMVIMLLVMLWFCKMKVLDRKAWVVFLFMLLPASEVVSEHWYFQATYMTLTIFLAVMILLTFMVLSESRKISRVSMCLLAVILGFRISMGYMMVLVFVLPMLATIAILMLGSIHRQDERKEIQAQYKNILGGGIAIIVGTLSGVVYNRYLINVCNTTGSATADFQFVDYKEIDMGRLLQGFLRLYGAADKGAGLISRSGIIKAIAIVYMIIMLFAVPYLLIKNFRNLKNEYQKIFLIFSIISTMAVIYLYIFTGMNQARYLLWIYFYSIIWLGICIDNESILHFEYAREIGSGFALYVFVLFCAVYAYYLTYDYENNPDALGINNDYVFYKADYKLVEYMEEKEYVFGYAPYWTAYTEYVISDGKVKIAALELDWTGPYLWLTSENWYKEDAHDGECFILIGDDMRANLPEIYEERAKSKDRYESYTIFLFDNIGVLREIWDEMKKL